MATNFMPSGAVRVDPADAYWFDELHGSDAEQGTVYYVGPGKGSIPAPKATLDEVLAGTVQLAPETYFNKPFDESITENFPGSIDSLSLDDWRYYGKDGEPILIQPIEDPSLVSYVVAIYTPDSGGNA